MNSAQPPTSTDSPPSPGRLALGGTILAVGFLSTALVPLVTGSTLPTAWKTVISGLLVFGIPEVFMLVAVAVLGRPGFEFLKRRLLQWMQPPERVGATRYRIGLVMFTLPLLLAFVSPYLSGAFSDVAQYRIWYGLSGDILQLASLLMLGGEFWDKLRALFVHDARAVFPGDTP
jgi:hypothetical protein